MLDGLKIEPLNKTEEIRLEVFSRKIFVPGKDAQIEKWRIKHDQEH